MPKAMKTTGSGMTQRDVVRFDAEEPDDLQALIAAGVHTLDRRSFQRLSRRLEGVAGSILSDAGLPSDPERPYLVASNGMWSVPEAEAAVDKAAESLPLDLAVQACGYQPDSPQGYAAALLMNLRKAREHLQASTIDDAMALAFAAGQLVNEAGMKEMFDAEFAIGADVREGGQKGHERAYGNEEEKVARRAEYTKAFDSARASGLGIMNAYAEAAKVFTVSARTISRAIKKR